MRQNDGRQPLDLLKQKIAQEGTVLDNHILKVDHFLNHQVDPQLMMAMGKDFYQYFKDQGITKVLTLEVSGIAVALPTAFYLKVPMLFAKKIASLTQDENVYTSQVTSYTKQKTYEIRIDRTYLSKSDKVLIIDDFLATGQALQGLIDLCQQAGATVAGIGIAIEKSFQPGAQFVKDAGYDLYSQARIKGFKNNQVEFYED